VGKRPYEQRLRAESAEETRRRILDALYERLREAPSDPVSVDEVARRARVARSTVYVVFGSRAGLFEALTTDLLQGAGYDRLLEAVGHPDAREHLLGGLAAGVEMYAAERDVLRILSSAAHLDPEGVGRAVNSIEEQRAAGMARVAGRLAEQQLLRPGVTPEQAADLIWLLTSFDTFDLLYRRGLTPDEISGILVSTAERTLLA
jgi:AcrR family transcriptional regulator